MPGRKGPNKRGKGEGSVFKVKRGEHIYWCGQVSAGRLPNGKRRYASVIRKTKREVLNAMPELHRRVGAGVVGPDQTVAQLLDEWLEVRRGKVTTTTLDLYRRRADHWIVPHVGSIPLRKLTTNHVRLMVRRLEDDGLSPASIKTSKTLLSSALKWAVGEQRITNNVCDYVEGIKLGAKLDDGLSDEEVDAVLTAAKDDRLYALLYMSVTLGFRQGEMLHLKWEDVDLEAGELRVDMAKTRMGERTIPLVASTHDALKAHRKRQAQEQLAAGPRWQDNGLVFTNDNGTPIHERMLRKWWTKTQETAGITHRRWHALRHSAAGRMLSNGVPLELVSVILGHAGISITADVYARYSKDAKRRELGRFMDKGNGTE